MLKTYLVKIFCRNHLHEFLQACSKIFDYFKKNFGEIKVFGYIQVRSIHVRNMIIHLIFIAF